MFAFDGRFAICGLDCVFASQNAATCLITRNQEGTS